MVNRKRKAEDLPNIQQVVQELRPVSTVQVAAVARVFAVPPRMVMGDDMYGNWKRRTKRLLRAHRVASHAGDYDRARAIYLAYRRLSTGSME